MVSNQPAARRTHATATGIRTQTLYARSGAYESALFASTADLAARSGLGYGPRCEGRNRTRLCYCQQEGRCTEDGRRTELTQLRRELCCRASAALQKAQRAVEIERQRSGLGLMLSSMEGPCSLLPQMEIIRRARRRTVSALNLNLVIQFLPVRVLRELSGCREEWYTKAP